MSNRTNRVHGFVSGRVQGVGFRYFVQTQARRHHLTGEVKNLGDGRVEFMAEGTESNLQAFLKQVERGPALSHVSRLDVSWHEPFGTYRSFDITH